MSANEERFEEPEWWDEDKLTKIRFAPNESGWAIALGDGQYRLVNNPIAAMCNYPGAARWGDIVTPGPDLIDDDGEVHSCLQIIERYAGE